MRVISVHEMKQMEQSANAAGYSYAEMMQRAGKGIADRIQAKFRKSDYRSVLGLVGSGNNGGDTLIALAELAGKGWTTGAVLIGKRKADDPELTAFLSAGGEMVEDSELSEINRIDSTSTILLDGVFGTGFHSTLPENVQEIFKGITDFWDEKRIVAVDCPSGVDCESGEVSPGTLRAGLTICLEAVKSGILKPPAISYCGELEGVDLDLARFSSGKGSHGVQVIDREMVLESLPGRSDCSHKGDYGKLMVIGGSTNFTGAPILAGRGAYAVGTGLVQIAVPEVIHHSCAGSNLEFTWLILDEVDGVISEPAYETIYSHLGGTDAIVLGPGIGREETTRRFIQHLLFEPSGAGNKNAIGFPGMNTQKTVNKLFSLPVTVVDADALTMLAGEGDWYARTKVKMVLTPHPGEMSRLTGLSIQEIQMHRAEVAARYAKQWGQTIVLKGSGTVIADGEGRIAILPVATSALAKAGTGDVLAGMIGGFLAQGLTAYTAAVCGAWLHGKAGIAAGASLGAEESVAASDVINSIPEEYRHLRLR